ncbi:MAG: Trm112 family protein [Candidatus Sumerlaeia bacterium]|nr:Trm112 family protein [Candidatus Sumerlaeia bacterium]
MIEKKLLDILACPLSKAPLVLDGDRLVSTCLETRRAYRIEEEIPVLLIEEATELSPQEHQEALDRLGVQPYKRPNSPSSN